MEPNVLTRLKRVAAKQTTTLTHYGRKTGKPHEVTIWFVVDDDKLYIGTANVNRHWVRNVQKTPKIRLSIGGETFDGNARFLTDRYSGNLSCFASAVCCSVVALPNLCFIKSVSAMPRSFCLLPSTLTQASPPPV
jgi:deazaflavin-dependent oxidoreductase (nitroreductase family)